MKILISIILILFICLFIVYYKKYKKQKKKYENINNKVIKSGIEQVAKETEYYKQQINIAQEEKEKTLLDFQKKLADEQKNLKIQQDKNKLLLNTLQQQKEALEQQLNLLQEQLENSVKIQQETIRQRLDGYETMELAKINDNLAAVTVAAELEATNKQKELIDSYERLKQEKITELNVLENQLLEYKEKEKVIQEAILRQRAIEEQRDFYRVNLSAAAIEDINVLNSIKNKLHISESFNKLVYDCFISKPVTEMIKRVLEGGSPCGIYKITRLKTGEVYIGKSTDIKSRWVQHCKTVFDVGTIAHSILHTTMKKDGIDNFTFELLEEVTKDKLTEREKYWIEFYHSKQYGLNEKNG